VLTGKLASVLAGKLGSMQACRNQDHIQSSEAELRPRLVCCCFAFAFPAHVTRLRETVNEIDDIAGRNSEMVKNNTKTVMVEMIAINSSITTVVVVATTTTTTTTTTSLSL